MSTTILVGRIGKDAETRTTQGGDKVTTFSVADDVGFGDKKKTQWWRCAMWGERGEKLAQYLTKGTMVEVTGQASARAYDKDGPQASLEMRVNEIKLHGGGKKDDAPAKNRDDMDDDIPF